VVLETLTPAERLAFVLHDMFDLPFDEIAPMVGRSPAAARQLGFVPIGGIGAALQMARGHRGQDARIGFLLAPPYFPLRVGSSET